MQTNQPTTLIPNEMIPILQNQALFSGDFTDFTGLENPWEVDVRAYTNLHDKLLTVENSIRSQYPDEEVTAIIAGTSLFWLSNDTLFGLRAEINDAIDRIKNQELLPTWRMTTAELLDIHIANMKRLILASAHDLALFDLLRPSFGDNAELLKREFLKCKRLVLLMLSEIEQHGNYCSSVITDNTKLYERFCITKRMIENGDLLLSQAGYSLSELKQVEEILDQRCKNEMPAYRQRIASMSNQMKDILRQGESTQLTRVSRWVMAYGMIDEPPKGFRGHADIVNMENEGLSLLVRAREEELGSSEVGQKALRDAMEAKSPATNGEQQKTEPAPEPPQQPSEPVSGNGSQTKKKSVRRMVFTSRNR